MITADSRFIPARIIKNDCIDDFKEELKKSCEFFDTHDMECLIIATSIGLYILMKFLTT